MAFSDLKLLPLSLVSPNKRERTFSSNTDFSNIQELFHAIADNQLLLDNDSSINVREQVGIVGQRDENPFVLLYSQKDVIAEGGFGVVYRGHLYQDLTNKYSIPVAIKVPLRDGGNSSGSMNDDAVEKTDEIVQELIWEIEVHSKIPAIAGIQRLLLTYDFGIVSPLRVGTSRLIIARPFEVKTQMVRALAIALSELKNAGFFYTDNKPDNFLLDDGENRLEVVDLSAVSHLPHVRSDQWSKMLFSKVFDGEELLLSIDAKYQHQDLWQKLKEARKETYKDYIEFQKMVENLMVFSLLVTAFELFTGELPNDNPRRAICSKSPIRNNAISLLIKAGCPDQKAKEIHEALHLKKNLTFETLLELLR